MLIHVIKFIHLLTIMGLIGITAFALTQQRSFLLLKKPISILAIISIVTGSLLIHPNHFSLQTPWIKAAYVLFGLFCTLMTALILLHEKLSKGWRSILYCLLILCLLLLIHDAVTKTTFLIR